jgi:hypothetical protein
MLEQIRKLKPIIIPVLLCAFVVTMTSCVTTKETALVQDPDSHHDSAIPWNKQEPWETGGQFANMTDRR